MNGLCWIYVDRLQHFQGQKYFMLVQDEIESNVKTASLG